MAVTPQTNVTLDEFAEALGRYDSFALCGHVSPDGDCLGSALALMHALRAMGKKATCILAKPDAVEKSFLFLPGADELVPACDFDDDVDAFIACDVPTLERLVDGACVHARAKAHFTIDHHAVDSCIAEYNYVDPDAPATGMLVWQLIAAMGVEPSQAMAQCCYLALMTDTGRFQFQNTSPEAFELAGEMVRAGAQPAACSREIYQRRTRASLGLEGVMLDNMQVSKSGAWALSHARLSDFERLGAVKADAEPLIDVLRSLDGIQVACMLREQEDVVRGSLRAKGDDIDVAALAQRIGGGGHKAAAGFTFKGSIDEALAQMPALLDGLFEGGAA